MNKKFPVALVASLILTNGSSIALATKVSDSDTTTTPTTVPVTRGKSKSTDPQKDAKDAKKAAQDDAIAKYRAELAKYLEMKKAINTAFKTAIANAKGTFTAANKSATTADARKAAQAAFETAVKTATETSNAAIKALGAPPKLVKP